MAATTDPPVETEMLILARVLGDEDGAMAPEVARHVLGPRVGERDPARMHDLVVRDQADAPSPEEKEDKWSRHFRREGPVLVGRTTVGRVTVELLRINDPLRVELRRGLIREGVLPAE